MTSRSIYDDVELILWEVVAQTKVGKESNFHRLFDCDEREEGNTVAGGVMMESGSCVGISSAI